MGIMRRWIIVCDRRRRMSRVSEQVRREFWKKKGAKPAADSILLQNWNIWDFWIYEVAYSCRKLRELDDIRRSRRRVRGKVAHRPSGERARRSGGLMKNLSSFHFSNGKWKAYSPLSIFFYLSSTKALNVNKKDGKWKTFILFRDSVSEPSHHHRGIDADWKFPSISFKFPWIPGGIFNISTCPLPGTQRTKMLKFN